MARQKVEEPEEEEPQEEEVAEAAEEEEEGSESLAGALQAQFKAAPWYMTSLGIHLIAFVIALLLTPPPKPPEKPPVVITTEVEEVKEEEKKEEEPPPPEIETPKETTEEVVVDASVQVETNVEVEVVVDPTDTEAPPEGDPSAFSEFDSDVDAPALMGIGSKGGRGGKGGKFGTRGGTGKGKNLRKGGGGKNTEQAVDMALKWLAAHQEYDGHWDCAKYEGKEGRDVAVTGLSLLAFLGAGNSPKFGKYKANVKKGVEWMLTQQTKEGHFGPYRYQAAIALMAMVEAYGMSESSELAGACQRAVDHAVASQGPDGGWRYSPKDPGDTSVAGWWMMALKSARVAGLNIPDKTWEGAKKYFTNIAVQSDDKYGYIGYYLTPGPNVQHQQKTAICTAAMMCCRQFLGYPRDDPIIVGAADLLLDEKVQGKKLPGKEIGKSQNFYLWYYLALGFYQLGTKSKYWQTFNPLMKEELLTTQIKVGTYEENKGSWDPKLNGGYHGAEEWGRVGQTAVGALMLEVYYRYDDAHKAKH